MSRRVILVAGFLAGCGFQAPPGIGHDAGTDDSRIVPGDDGGPMTDAPADASTPPPNTVCYGSFGMACIATPLPPSITVNGGVTLAINTDDTTMCIPTVAGTTISNSPCVIGATTVMINGTIKAMGSHPLVIIGTASITINGGGVLDVSSHANARGAGASSSCSGANGPVLGGGGAGGSFYLGGGQGGNGGAGIGGTPNTTLTLTYVRGGCPGEHGGYGTGGAGGYGGGGVDLIGDAITINGLIAANGAGGQGASIIDSGGGGGGSGGSIVLDTQNLTSNGSARYMAQGGSGGEGSSTLAKGNDGKDPATPGTAAVGGEGNSSGGGGGDGGVSNGGMPAGSGGAGSGGGGGGGGPGFVHTTDSQYTNGGMAFPAFN